ncbi:MAG: hypothetical protein ACTSW4_01440 [Candidatus Ranarchaeia archaeon]
MTVLNIRILAGLLNLALAGFGFLAIGRIPPLAFIMLIAIFLSGVTYLLERVSNHDSGLISQLALGGYMAVFLADAFFSATGPDFNAVVVALIISVPLILLAQKIKSIPSEAFIVPGSA